MVFMNGTYPLLMVPFNGSFFLVSFWGSNLFAELHAPSLVIPWA